MGVMLSAAGDQDIGLAAFNVDKADACDVNAIIA
jgi:hypothetical protein